MSWAFDNSVPIYIQIIDRIKLLIISGKLAPGEKIASVRDLAEESGVNPNTMQRALTELEREGLIHSVRTSGKFVTEDGDSVRQLREKMAQEKIEALFSSLTGLRYSREEIAKLVSERVNQNG